MKLICLVSLLCLLSVVCAYKDIDDMYNYYADVHDKAKLKAIVDCFLDKATCTDTLKPIKSHMQQVMMDGCAECDTIQKHYTHEFFDAVRRWYPQEVPALDKKYDADGKHLVMLEKSVADN